MCHRTSQEITARLDCKIGSRSRPDRNSPADAMCHLCSVSLTQPAGFGNSATGSEPIMLGAMVWGSLDKGGLCGSAPTTVAVLTGSTAQAASETALRAKLSQFIRNQTRARTKGHHALR